MFFFLAEVKKSNKQEQTTTTTTTTTAAAAAATTTTTTTDFISVLFHRHALDCIQELRASIHLERSRCDSTGLGRTQIP